MLTKDWLAPVTTLLDDPVASGHLPGALLAVRRARSTTVRATGRHRSGDDDPMTEDTLASPRLASVTEPIAVVLLTQRFVAGRRDTHDAFWRALHAAITDQEEVPS